MLLGSPQPFPDLLLLRWGRSRAKAALQRLLFISPQRTADLLCRSYSPSQHQAFSLPESEQIPGPVVSRSRHEDRLGSSLPPASVCAEGPWLPAPASGAPPCRSGDLLGMAPKAALSAGPFCCSPLLSAEALSSSDPHHFFACVMTAGKKDHTHDAHAHRAHANIRVTRSAGEASKSCLAPSQVSVVRWVREGWMLQGKRGLGRR